MSSFFASRVTLILLALLVECTGKAGHSIVSEIEVECQSISIIKSLRKHVDEIDP